MCVCVVGISPAGPSFISAFVILSHLIPPSLWLCNCYPPLLSLSPLIHLSIHLCPHNSLSLPTIPHYIWLYPSLSYTVMVETQTESDPSLSCMCQDLITVKKNLTRQHSDLLMNFIFTFILNKPSAWQYIIQVTVSQGWITFALTEL